MITGPPRLLESSPHYTAEQMSCAKCRCQPPTRWWGFDEMLQWLPTDSRSAIMCLFAADSPVFLCDRCTSYTDPERPEPEPFVWEDDRIRFTVDPNNGEIAITLLGDHTDEQTASACRTLADMRGGDGRIPLNEGGFQWMACEVRMAARVVNLHARVAKLRTIIEELFLESAAPDHSGEGGSDA